ncbi:MAG: glycosyltransferase family 2 protein [Flavobacteriaceae bacterium]|nr:glycosyltransferase family 2 protein [Flavobacteriaceae bacterium]
MELTIIVPVYNEANNLARLENELSKFIMEALVPTKVLFINDGSQDNSLEIIQSICRKHERFSHLSFDKNYGLSTALKAGFDNINTALTGYIDADLQTHPEDFNLLLKHIKSYDLITGNRAHRKDSFLKRITSTSANFFRRIFTGDGMEDTGCPLKIIKTEYAKKIPMFKGFHRFLPALVLLQNGTVKQIPVPHYPRIADTTSFGLLNRSIAIIDCFFFLWVKYRYINYTITTASN